MLKCPGCVAEAHCDSYCLHLHFPDLIPPNSGQHTNFWSTLVDSVSMVNTSISIQYESNFRIVLTINGMCANKNEVVTKVIL